MTYDINFPIGIGIKTQNATISTKSLLCSSPAGLHRVWSVNLQEDFFESPIFSCYNFAHIEGNNKEVILILFLIYHNDKYCSLYMEY